MTLTAQKETEKTETHGIRQQRRH